MNINGVWTDQQYWIICDMLGNDGEIGKRTSILQKTVSLDTQVQQW